MNKEVLNTECTDWLKESLTDFFQDGYELELVFATPKENEKLVVAVIDGIPNAYENITSYYFVQHLQDSFLKKYGYQKKGWKFNIRFIEKRKFLHGVFTFDPDLLSFFTSDIQVIIGEDKYSNVKNNFIKSNYNPELRSVFLPYMQDLLHSWKTASDKLNSFDIELTRSFFNGVKLFYVITENSSDLTIENLARLTDGSYLHEIFKSIPFLVENEQKEFSKEQIEKEFFKQSENNIHKKLILVEEFLIQELSWIFEWIENKGYNLDTELIMNWLLILNDYFQFMPQKDTFKDYAFKIIKTLELSLDKDTDEYTQLKNIAKRINIYAE